MQSRAISVHDFASAATAWAPELVDDGRSWRAADRLVAAALTWGSIALVAGSLFTAMATYA